MLKKKKKLNLSWFIITYGVLMTAFKLIPKNINKMSFEIPVESSS